MTTFRHTVTGEIRIMDDIPAHKAVLWEPYVLPEPTPQEMAAQIEAAIVANAQARLDAWAQERGYDDVHSLCTYAGDPDPTFDAEGQLGRLKRSQMWAALRARKLAVLAGAAPMPQTLDDVEGLPTLTWS